MGHRLRHHFIGTAEAQKENYSVLYALGCIFILQRWVLWVGLKESRRRGGGLESPGVEDMHDPASGHRRIPLLGT